MINAQQLTKSPTSARDILPTPPLTNIKKSSTERSHSFVDQFHGAHQDPNSPAKIHHPYPSKTERKSLVQTSNELIQGGTNWLMRHVVENEHLEKALDTFKKLLEKDDPSHEKKFQLKKI